MIFILIFMILIALVDFLLLCALITKNFLAMGLSVGLLAVVGYFLYRAIFQFLKTYLLAYYERQVIKRAMTDPEHAQLMQALAARHQTQLDKDAQRLASGYERPIYREERRDD